ncbi:hypothetical protein [Actinomyces oris]|uniref:hypothetical protein n=1 Tax=Actinomyces oris TaxID=544580 RepID=UPI001181B81C|nr:hypothetical protein [Actinomyces oris]
MSIASFSVDTAVGVVTALTGLIAAAVAATQLSYRHRMMRTATWAQEQAPSATGERKQHLENMQRWAQSEVVAATMIPAKVFVEPLFTAMLVLLTPVLHDPPLYPFALTAFLVQALQYRRTIRLYLERQRCAVDYYEGRTVQPAHIGLLFQMEGGTRKEFLWASIVSAELTAVSLLLVRYIHHEHKTMLPLAIVVCVGVINSVADIRRKNRHPFLAQI